MKCDDFKFEYTAAPSDIAGDAYAHLQACSSCQQFAEQQRAFEQQLGSVINCAVPEGYRQSLRASLPPANGVVWRWPKTSIALAASVLLAVGVMGIMVLQKGTTQFTIDQLVVEHFEHDGAHSMLASNQINRQQLEQISRPFGVQVGLLGNISFAEKCPIGDSYGLHMVYQYNDQMITVIYMPEIPLQQTLPFSYSGLKGWVKPLKKGSLAVLVGASDELPDETFANQAIEWL